MIQLDQIEKTYAADGVRYTALRRIDLRIDAGELVAIAGKSGSGKTTLLNVIAGLDTPTAGSVTVAGASLASMSESRLAVWRGRHVGIVFQFFQLLPALTALENVMLAMDFAGVVPRTNRRAKALDLLDRFGVSGQARKLPSTLSGGEQQRVAIARALANDPPLVVADEPTGNLDSATAAGVLALFRQLASDGKTVVIATHDRDVKAISDRTVELADGIVIRTELAA
ncbi:MAG TPA: ABC transporter ATP-binding protein [Thermoanaerobaculia bacterium]|jgi:putative ABC transport system ATP-binding protein|nr:ABC transporter ATP-binding protein [Thermoanaerobaculia bacterium]